MNPMKPEGLCIFPVLLLLVLLTGIAWADPPEGCGPDRHVENGWLKVVDEYVEELTAEEFYRENLLESNRGKTIRILKVKAEFLQQCRAAMKMEGIDESSLPDDERHFLSTYREWQRAEKAEKKRTADRLYETLIRMPNFRALKNEYLIKSYRCDDEIQIRVTYCSSRGEENETVGRVPVASQINYILDRQKTRKMAGDTMWVSFLIPDDAAQWRVWVPR
jgi:hypothetical protein